MWNQIKNKVMVILMAGMLFSIAISSWFKGTTDYSISERRVLARFPKLNIETVLSGKFMKEFEIYTLDQFPLRDTFRSLKSAATLYLFGQSEVNDLYCYDGYITKMEYPLNDAMLLNAGKKFQWIYDTYLKETEANVYFSIVPDKNYFLAKEANMLSVDYKAMVEMMKEETPYMKYIDIFQQLEINNYYKTDTHWKQETLLPIAEYIAGSMGTKIEKKYKEEVLDSPFYGVYYGQLSLPVKPDKIKYFTNDTIDSCIVTSYNTGAPVPSKMYDLSKADSKDPYEMFVCGNDALVTIENPKGNAKKELIIFRDSFTSSLSPLLATGYRKVTLVDIRYLHPGMIGSFIKFKDQDVLFLYSTLVLNNSTSFK